MVIATHPPPFHVYGVVLADIADLIHRHWTVKVTYVMREVNASADMMVKLGASSHGTLKLWPEPPNQVLAYLLSDSIGIVYTRL